MIRERLSNVWGIATDTQLIIVGRKGRCAVASAIACSRPVIHDNVIAIVTVPPHSLYCSDQDLQAIVVYSQGFASIE